MRPACAYPSVVQSSLPNCPDLYRDRETFGYGVPGNHPPLVQTMTPTSAVYQMTANPGLGCSSSISPQPQLQQTQFTVDQYNQLQQQPYNSLSGESMNSPQVTSFQGQQQHQYSSVLVNSNNDKVIAQGLSSNKISNFIRTPSLNGPIAQSQILSTSNPSPYCVVSTANPNQLVGPLPQRLPSMTMNSSGNMNGNPPQPNQIPTGGGTLRQNSNTRIVVSESTNFQQPFYVPYSAESSSSQTGSPITVPYSVTTSVNVPQLMNGSNIINNNNHSNMSGSMGSAYCASQQNRSAAVNSRLQNANAPPPTSFTGLNQAQVYNVQQSRQMNNSGVYNNANYNVNQHYVQSVSTALRPSLNSGVQLQSVSVINSRSTTSSTSVPSTTLTIARDNTVNIPHNMNQHPQQIHLSSPPTIPSPMLGPNNQLNDSSGTIALRPAISVGSVVFNQPSGPNRQLSNMMGTGAQTVLPNPSTSPCGIPIGNSPNLSQQVSIQPNDFDGRVPNNSPLMMMAMPVSSPLPQPGLINGPIHSGMPNSTPAPPPYHQPTLMNNCRSVCSSFLSPNPVNINQSTVTTTALLNSAPTVMGSDSNIIAGPMNDRHNLVNCADSLCVGATPPTTKQSVGTVKGVRQKRARANKTSSGAGRGSRANSKKAGMIPANVPVVSTPELFPPGQRVLKQNMSSWNVGGSTGSVNFNANMMMSTNMPQPGSSCLNPTTDSRDSPVSFVAPPPGNVRPGSGPIGDLSTTTTNNNSNNNLNYGQAVQCTELSSTHPSLRLPTSPRHLYAQSQLTSSSSQQQQQQQYTISNPNQMISNGPYPVNQNNNNNNVLFQQINAQNSNMSVGQQQQLQNQLSYSSGPVQTVQQRGQPPSSTSVQFQSTPLPSGQQQTNCGQTSVTVSTNRCNLNCTDNPETYISNSSYVTESPMYGRTPPPPPTPLPPSAGVSSSYNINPGGGNLSSTADPMSITSTSDTDRLVCPITNGMVWGPTQLQLNDIMHQYLPEGVYLRRFDFDLTANHLNTIIGRSDLDIVVCSHLLNEPLQVCHWPPDVVQIRFNDYLLRLDRSSVNGGQPAHKVACVKQLCRPGRNQLEIAVLGLGEDPNQPATMAKRRSIATTLEAHRFAAFMAHMPALNVLLDGLQRRRPTSVSVLCEILQNRFGSQQSIDEPNAGPVPPIVAELNLICPVFRTRMRIPGRVAGCQHVEAFDMEAFLRREVLWPRLNCPICGHKSPAGLDGLCIDITILYALHLLHPVVETILVRSDGYWRLTPPLCLDLPPDLDQWQPTIGPLTEVVTQALNQLNSKLQMMRFHALSTNGSNGGAIVRHPNSGFPPPPLSGYSNNNNNVNNQPESNAVSSRLQLQRMSPQQMHKMNASNVRPKSMTSQPANNRTAGQEVIISSPSSWNTNSYSPHMSNFETMNFNSATNELRNPVYTSNTSRPSSQPVPWSGTQPSPCALEQQPVTIPHSSSSPLIASDNISHYHHTDTVTDVKSLQSPSKLSNSCKLNNRSNNRQQAGVTNANTLAKVRRGSTGSARVAAPQPPPHFSLPPPSSSDESVHLSKVSVVQRENFENVVPEKQSSLPIYSWSNSSGTTDRTTVSNTSLPVSPVLSSRSMPASFSLPPIPGVNVYNVDENETTNNSPYHTQQIITSHCSANSNLSKSILSKEASMLSVCTVENTIIVNDDDDDFTAVDDEGDSGNNVIAALANTPPPPPTTTKTVFDEKVVMEHVSPSLYLNDNINRVNFSTTTTTATITTNNVDVTTTTTAVRNRKCVTSTLNMGLDFLLTEDQNNEINGSNTVISNNSDSNASVINSDDNPTKLLSSIPSTSSSTDIAFVGTTPKPTSGNDNTNSISNSNSIFPSDCVTTHSCASTGMTINEHGKNDQFIIDTATTLSSSPTHPLSNNNTNSNNNNNKDNCHSDGKNLVATADLNSETIIMTPTKPNSNLLDDKEECNDDVKLSNSDVTVVKPAKRMKLESPHISSSSSSDSCNNSPAKLYYDHHSSQPTTNHILGNKRDNDGEADDSVDGVDYHNTDNNDKDVKHKISIKHSTVQQLHESATDDIRTRSPHPNVALKLDVNEHKELISDKYESQIDCHQYHHHHHKQLIDGMEEDDDDDSLSLELIHSMSSKIDRLDIFLDESYIRFVQQYPCV